MPVYGFGGLFIAFMYEFRDLIPWYWRMIIYAIVFNIIELIGGYISEDYICNKVDTCYTGNRLWRYDGKYTIDGYVDIEHTIYWMIAGLIGEQIYDYIKNQSFIYILSLMLTTWVIISIHKYKSINNNILSSKMRLKL